MGYEDLVKEKGNLGCPRCNKYKEAFNKLKKVIDESSNINDLLKGNSKVSKLIVEDGALFIKVLNNLLKVKNGNGK